MVFISQYKKIQKYFYQFSLKAYFFKEVFIGRAVGEKLPASMACGGRKAGQAMWYSGYLLNIPVFLTG